MISSTIPFIGITDLPSIWRDTKGFHEAFDNGLTEIFEQAYHEGGLRNLKVIGLSNIGFWYIATTKKPFRVPADLKGLKIVGCGSMHVKYIDACGGTGMYIEIPERYEAIQRGIVDGCTGFTSNYVGWKFMEPAEYMLDFAPGLGPMMIIINKKSLEEKVPKDLREPLVMILKYMILAHRGAMAADTIYEHDIIMRKHMKYYKPTSEEEALWIKAGRPVVEEWISKTGDLGKKAMKIVEKYNAR
jgi:TRAP-type C4-dicarboxylate transport system substrate-binding protein